MKFFVSALVSLLFVSCASGKGKTFTGSTPAGIVVRNFLGISTSDSVDFIRWLLEIDGNNYKLDCSYGVGKPNTNGFIDGGRIVKINGLISKTKQTWILTNQGKELRIAELNNSLLHPLDENNHFLIGTGGWSYTLCSLNPIVEAGIAIPESPWTIKDSVSFVGRTPCGFPGLVKDTCYRLKWAFVFYPASTSGEPGLYLARGTLFRDARASGTWRSVKAEDGAIYYELRNEKNLPFLYFIRGADEVIFFTDSKGKLLVGNEDFSYTLSRKI